jgi:hypothetical protein
LLNDNRKCCEHFLNECDEFLYQKCVQRCEKSIKLMNTAFISTKYLKKDEDLDGDNVIVLFKNKIVLN